MSESKRIQQITGILSNMKGKNIVAYDISEVSSLADYLVICTGNSETHVSAMAETVHQTMKDAGDPATAQDGKRGSKWVCMDFGDVIVHVMGQSERDFYSLESIWGGCEDVYTEAS